MGLGFRGDLRGVVLGDMRGQLEVPDFLLGVQFIAVTGLIASVDGTVADSTRAVHATGAADCPFFCNQMNGIEFYLWPSKLQN